MLAATIEAHLLGSSEEDTSEVHIEDEDGSDLYNS